MRSTPTRLVTRALAIAMGLAISGGAVAQAAGSGHAADRLQLLEAQVRAQIAQIEALEQRLSQQQQHVDALDQAVTSGDLTAIRARGAAPRMAADGRTPSAAGAAEASSPTAIVIDGPAIASAQDARTGTTANETGVRVGRAPENASRPPEVAQIFEQPGVLTAAGRFVVEPSLQVGYSSSDRVALVGYTVIPAILIGLIDVRQVKTTSLIGALTARYGVGSRLELEAKVPYVYVNGDTVSREIFTGAAQDSVFNADGRGIGDVELTARYQLRNSAPDRPFYVLWLRYKSRTGKDVFDVVTDCVTRCVANATGTGLPLELPTGSGFNSLQPGVTWLYASDPVVFFGSLSYLHNFKRDDVSRTVLSGAPAGFPQTSTEFIGEVQAGDIAGFNLGVGLALNERAAISFGYDQSFVGKTRQNGVEVPGAVRVILGTLVLGGSYRISDRTSLNVALGVGATRDTPDVSLAVRLPVTF